MEYSELLHGSALAVTVTSMTAIHLIGSAPNAKKLLVVDSKALRSVVDLLCVLCVIAKQLHLAISEHTRRVISQKFLGTFFFRNFAGGRMIA